MRTHNCLTVIFALVISIISLSACGGGGGGGVPTPSASEAATLTREAVNVLITGDEDFNAISQKLQQAINLDPSNKTPVFFKAIADYLSWLKPTLMDPAQTTDSLRVLYTDAGMYNAGEVSGLLQDLEFERQIIPFNCLGTGCTGYTVNTYRGHNYLFSSSQQDWTTAQIDCRSFGGDLVSVNDVDEDAWIASQLTENTWIGLYSGVTPIFPFIMHSFQWSNGEEDDYSNWDWMNVEPSWWASGENCVMMKATSYVWHNTTCGQSMKYVCEEIVDESQGDFRDSVPTGDEIRSFIVDNFIPRLEVLLADLEQLPSNFEYVLYNVDAGGSYFDGSAIDDTLTYWVDYGDVSAFKSVVSLTLAGLRGPLAYDWENLNMNDFDDAFIPVDIPGFINTNYPNLGTLLEQPQLSAARLDVEKAFQYYSEGILYITNETQLQSETGLLTMSRNSIYWGMPITIDPSKPIEFKKLWRGFDSEEDRQKFLDDVSYFKNWGQNIVSKFNVDVDHTFDHEPGGLEDPNLMITANFYQFWSGVVDYRNIYFKTITDPIDNITLIGVTSSNTLNDTNMLTAGGVIDKINGVILAPGDLQHKQGYAVRVDSPAIDTKTIDGNISDWSTNFTNVGLRPWAHVQPPRSDFGEVYVARDASNLFILLTSRMSSFDRAKVEVKSVNVYTYLDFWFVIGFFAWGPVATPIYSDTSSGTEIGIPLSNFGIDQWVEISVVMEPSSGGSWKRHKIFVKIVP